MIEYAKLLTQQGSSLGQLATKTGIPKTSLHRYFAEVHPTRPTGAESALEGPPPSARTD
ncbi:MAG: hypothetical protein JO362_23370 [Streptomycetaceae bacterium]|nr:hypothetical protein [Streptomycetaceae bacterium]